MTLVMSDAEDLSLRQRKVVEGDEAEFEAENTGTSIGRDSPEDSQNDSEASADEKAELVQPSPPVTGVRVYRGIQPRPPPSFLFRQFTNIKNFFIEFFEFIMLL